jgi:hypothetical protein
MTQLTFFNFSDGSTAAAGDAGNAQIAIFAECAPSRPALQDAGDPRPDVCTRPELMTLTEFIAKHRARFVSYRGHRNIVGVQTLDGVRILPLPAGAQRNGVLQRPAEDVLAEIHRDLITTTVERFVRESRYPTLRAGALRPADAVLSDYPDLATAVALGITPAAVAMMAAQPTAWTTIEEHGAPKSLSALKKALTPGVALTRVSSCDDTPMHVIVRHVQSNAFVTGPAAVEDGASQKHADGLWHYFVRAHQYSFRPEGFEVEMNGGHRVKYLYGHVARTA